MGHSGGVYGPLRGIYRYIGHPGRGGYMGHPEGYIGNSGGYTFHSGGIWATQGGIWATQGRVYGPLRGYTGHSEGGI